MDIFDNEIEIIEHFQNIDTSSVLLLPSTPECEELFMSIWDKDKWKTWRNSSGKSDPPPDFFSDALGFMMDVMRVDDHEFKNKKRKVVNPTRQRETKVTQELRDAGVFELFPNAKPFLVVDTGLSTHEDHNYNFYKKNFARVVGTHKRKISNYKANHPILRTVFFVFDESSQYMEVKEKSPSLTVGTLVPAMPHLWFLDEEFVKEFRGSEIDYIVWFTPYKHCQAHDQQGNRLTLPEAVIINTSENFPKTIKYDNDLMEGAEV